MGIQDLRISISPEVIGHIGKFPLTNTFFITLIITFFLIGVSLIFSRRLKLRPRGWQNFIELVIESLFNFVDEITGDREQTKKFFPLVATIFIFVILINWVELWPGLGIVGVRHGKEIVPLIRSAASSLNFTLALACISVIFVQIMGVFFLGARKYFSKFFVAPWKKPYLIGTFVGLLELISEFSKVISFSFRLFGNIFAGEALLMVFLFLVPQVFNLLPLPFLFLELFVGFIQALVFSMLTLIFLKAAVTEMEH